MFTNTYTSHKDYFTLEGYYLRLLNNKQNYLLLSIFVSVVKSRVSSAQISNILNSGRWSRSFLQR